MKEKLLELIKKVTDNNNVQESSALLDEGWLDSLSTIILIQEIEDEFSIEINNDDLNHDNFNSVDNIKTLIEKTVNDKNI